MDPLGVAVVGLGIGRAHLAAFRELPDRWRVLAVCDPDARRRDRAAEVSGASPAAALEDLLGDPAIDVVDICSPPALHLEQAVAALGSGHHVIVEKPATGSLAELDQLAAAADAARRQVMPVFQYRFGNGVRRLRHLVDAGATGRAHTATVEVAWRRRPDYYAVPWRGTWAGELGGALSSHALHAVDMLVWILGPPTRVCGRVTTRVNPVETEDTAAALLEWADGALGTLSVTLGSSAEISRHRFCFEHLTAESGTAPYDNGADPWTITPDSDEVAATLARALGGFVPGPEGYVALFAAVADAMRAGAPPPVTLADAAAALEVVDAVRWSSATGGSVALPLPSGHPARVGAASMIGRT